MSVELKALYLRSATWPARENWPARPLVFLLDPETGVDYRVDATPEVVAHLEARIKTLTPIVARCGVFRAEKKSGSPQLRIEGLGSGPKAGE